jgi:hypothetical protein
MLRHTGNIKRLIGGNELPGGQSSEASDRERPGNVGA